MQWSVWCATACKTWRQRLTTPFAPLHLCVFALNLETKTRRREGARAQRKKALVLAIMLCGCRSLLCSGSDWPLHNYHKSPIFWIVPRLPLNLNRMSFALNQRNASAQRLETTSTRIRNTSSLICTTIFSWNLVVSSPQPNNTKKPWATLPNSHFPI